MESSPHALSAGERPELRPAALFVNVQARSGAVALPTVRRALQRRGFPIQLARAVRRPERFRALIEEAYQAGVRTFLVGGGDGTISSAARVLAGTDAVLGVLPLGTGNDFARSLGLPLGLEAACEVITAGHVRAVDVGVANGRTFLNAATLGLSAFLTRKLSPGLKKTAGRFAYPLVALQSSLELPPFRVHLTIDDHEERSFEARQVVVGNGHFHGGGSVVAEDATLDDHTLHVWALTADTEENAAALKVLAQLARVALHMRSGTQDELRNVLAFSASTLRIGTDTPQEVHVDGESLGTTPVDFHVWPGALRVFAPVGALPVTR